MQSNSGIPIPVDAYPVGIEPRGGRRAKYPFKTMEFGQHFDVLLDSSKNSKHRNQVMSAIRQVQYRHPKWQFVVKDIMPSDAEPTLTGLTLRVWRTKDKGAPPLVDPS